MLKQQTKSVPRRRGGRGGAYLCTSNKAAAKSSTDLIGSCFNPTTCEWPSVVTCARKSASVYTMVLQPNNKREIMRENTPAMLTPGIDLSLINQHTNQQRAGGDIAPSTEVDFGRCAPVGTHQAQIRRALKACG
jgi:hypothetical protein